MLFWSILTLLAALTGLWMARPFLRRGQMEMDATDSSISIYRDQLDEVERDRQAGLISDGECQAARHEIERRALSAARNLDQGFFVGHRSVPAGLGLAGVSVAAVVGLYAALGAPDEPDQPLAARRTEMLTQQAAAGDINSSIQLLVDAAAETPDDFETWWVLARSYAEIGDNASAADAYRHAVELSDNNPAVLSAYAEAMTLANGNKVPPAARILFEQVLAEQADSRARYYVALAKAQSQDFEGAVQDWSRLYADSPPNAPWVAMIRRDIINMTRFLKHDIIRYLPDATPAEIAAAGGTDSPAASADRVAELTAVLAADPTDYKAWIALATEQSGLGNNDAALAAINEGRRHFKAAPFVLQMFDETARALGLDMLDRGPGVTGPDADQIAAVTALSQEEQDDMIDGMVAGLAAKLEENPDNLDGWIMLVRSYANLGRLDKARAAYASAMDHYDGNDSVLAELRAGAGEVIGAN